MVAYSIVLKMCIHMIFSKYAMALLGCHMLSFPEHVFVYLIALASSMSTEENYFVYKNKQA